MSDVFIDDPSDEFHSNLLAEEEARYLYWSQRNPPIKFDPIQIKQKDLTCKCLDWWNTRSSLFCCCFPVLRCVSACCFDQDIQVIDGKSMAIWEKQLKDEVDSRCPEELRGVWWMQYNYAHEQLVLAFSDAEWVGGKEYGLWQKSLRNNWSRDNTCFGHILLMNGAAKNGNAKGSYNLKDGKIWVQSDDGDQLVYRISEDEWWKIHYEGKLMNGEKNSEKITFQYKWLKVIDKDGIPTKHWNTYLEWSTSPLPHRNCGTSWLPCWGCCISDLEAKENMIYPNPRQIMERN